MVINNTLSFDLSVWIDCSKKIDRCRIVALVNKLARSIVMDGFNINAMDNNDAVFTPRTDAERILWENGRSRAKQAIKTLAARIAGGYAGGRPTKK